VHTAAAAFPRVALYFENSILKPDLPLLAAASAVVNSYAQDKVSHRISIDTATDVEVAWPAAGALVDGKPWPFESGTAVRLAAGRHVIDPAPKRDGISVSDLNATLRSASAEGKRLRFRYLSDSRAIVRFDRRPAAMEVDGQSIAAGCLKSGFAEAEDCTMLLPRGEHDVTAR
jgi:hypothetical protein